jgi:hypothetical protein
MACIARFALAYSRGRLRPRRYELNHREYQKSRCCGPDNTDGYEINRVRMFLLLLHRRPPFSPTTPPNFQAAGMCCQRQLYIGLVQSG